MKNLFDIIYANIGIAWVKILRLCANIALNYAKKCKNRSKD